MAKRSGILIGTAGVYHVASQLAQQGFHAAVTFIDHFPSNKDFSLGIEDKRTG